MPRLLLVVVLWLSLRSLGGATPPIPPLAAQAATPVGPNEPLLSEDGGFGLGLLKLLSRSLVEQAASELLLSRRLVRKACSRDLTR